MAVHEGAVEGDLATRIQARLDQVGTTWATVRLAGRSVAIAGTAPSTEEQRMALEAVNAVWGVGPVTDASTLIPLVEPFVWSAAKTAGGLTVAGYVPSEKARANLRQLAASTNLAAGLRDNTELARGAPAGFESATGFAFRFLADVATGSASITGDQVSVEGTALDTPRYEAARQLIARGAPAGVTVARAEILPPLADPFVWSVAYDGSGARIEGSVPSEEVGESLAAALAADLGGVPTDDRTTLASGAPPGFAETAKTASAILARLGTGSITLTGTDLEISGRARSLDDYDALLALLGSGAAGIRITSAAIAPALVQPYLWQATRSGRMVELAGFMPSDQAREEVVDEANRIFGAGNVQHRLRIADGAPRMDWIGASKFALTQLAALSGGAVTIIDRTYSITGTTATVTGFDEITERLGRTLPASLDLGDHAVLPPFVTPYRLAAARTAEGFAIEGNLPDHQTREAVGAAAVAHFGDTVHESATLASGAPDGFAEAAAAAIQAVSRLSGGRFEIVGRTISIAGEAAYAFAADRIEQELAAALPPGFEVKAALTVAPPQPMVEAAECQALVAAALQAEGIRFGRGDAAAAPESEGLLDRIVAIVQRCPRARIEIGGHTDSRGSSRRNRELSQQRAEAVLNYLIEAGVQKDRLAAVGYGESKPVADNETEEGRARNRRIEFRIEEP